MLNPTKYLIIVGTSIVLSLSWCSSISHAKTLEKLFYDEKLTSADSVLVTQIHDSGHNDILYQWQADKPLVPASLAKLATSYLAIKKWGLNKRFETQFYRHGNTLWVKGFGDPYLVSEEIDLIVSTLKIRELNWIREIAIDRTYFKDQAVPGRSGVADPYNAPLSAVSANFNTTKLINNDGQFLSAEAQTPLTDTAVYAAKQLARPHKGKTERINLINADNSARNFAQILATKLNMKGTDLRVTGSTPREASLIYTHANSHSLKEVLRGTLEYSNNFMANQLFLMLLGKAKSEFSQASIAAMHQLEHDFGWQDFALIEGAGLSRQNKLSAKQLNNLLSSLSQAKDLFRNYSDDKAVLDNRRAQIRAKTGTLNGVRSFAGYVDINEQEYQFVFNFNRKVPYKYRESLLKKLVENLQNRTHD